MSNKFKEDLDKNELIKKELRRLKGLFKDLDKNKKSMAEPLFDQLAFLTVSISELQDIINKFGYTENYQNGENQSGVKKSAEVDIHNNMSKLYIAAFKQLIDMLPVSESKDELLDFIKRSK